MIRPILLLFDEDHSELEKLEGRLVHSFGSVLRVEAFAREQDVQASLDGWSEEGRAVLVKLVVRRGEATSRTDLIRQIQESAAGTESAAILVTDRADLGEMLWAKNDAQIARVFEEPADPRQLEQAVADLLLRSLQSVSYLSLRELKERSELEDAFRLRQEVYREDPEVKAWIDPDAEFDIDAFDGRSIQLGLFEHRLGGSAELIGTSRLITSQRQVTAEQLEGRIPEDATVPWPFVDYWPESVALGQLTEHRTSGEGSVTEGSRLVVRRSARGRQPVSTLAAGTIRFGLAAGYRTCILVVRPAHVRFWRRLGFAPVDDVEPKLLHEVVEMVPIAFDVNRVPQLMVGASVETRRREEGLPICTCDSRTVCENAGYDDGDLSSVDLLCPFAADRLLRRFHDDA